MLLYDPHSQPTFDPFQSIPAAGEARREALDRLRNWLLQAVGCEWDLEKLLELADERISYEELASAIGMNRGSLWRLVWQALDQIRFAALAEVAVGALLHDTGFTLDPETARLVEPTGEDCFAVSLAGDSLSLAEPAVEEVLGYIKANGDRLLRKRTHKVYLGGWRPDPASQNAIIDLTVLIADEAEARDFGRRQGQNAIYNFRTREEIWLRKKGRRAA